jgi:hypothetical protein
MNGKIILFCKGADTVIKERLDPKSIALFDDTEEHLNVLNLSRRLGPENKVKFFFKEICRRSLKDVVFGLERNIREGIRNMENKISRSEVNKF